MKLSFITLLSTILFYTSEAQNCGCTLAEVESNSVAPCMETVGVVVNVATVSEFYGAISQANNNGGNMTILIADGTYAVASTAQYPYITASNMVIRSASGNRDAVVLTGQGMQAVNGTEIGLFLVGENITVADLTIRDVGNHGIATYSDDHYIHNVRIQNTFEQMIKGNSVGDGPDNCTVQCCLLEYTAGVGPQWYIGGLDIHGGNNWLVRDNVFKSIASPSQQEAEHAVHFWDDSGQNVVERNMMVNCDRGVGFGLGSSPNEGGIIRNNMIYNDGSGVFDDVGIGLETSPNTEVYNNTIHIQYANAIEYRFASTSGVQITNNITNRLIRSRNGGTATVTTNNTDGEASWYINPSGGDLRLSSAVSDVVDQGADLGNLVPDDIDQNSRPQGAAFDLGAQEYPSSVVDLDMDGFDSTEDCDDNNPDINPDAIEIANNEVDEDCDGEILIIDVDMDGFNSDEDCDDNDPNINPDAVEIANNAIDEDCDGSILIIDDDMDGFNSDEDCDDSNSNINPDEDEIPNNDIDENCDGVVLVIDVDMDGFNSDEDCNDEDPNINPDATEIPNNDVDENCDGSLLIIDLDMDGFDSDEDCDDENPDINPDAEEIPNNDIDENCDGEILVIDVDMDGFNSDDDCDDEDSEINPSATEIPNNDIDENCDGEVLIIDVDMDGFHSDEDCDDEDPDINPGAEEVPNNEIDEDCDGDALIIDVDMDGYNSDEDCDDMNPDIHPMAMEIPDNGIDEDCDGEDQISTSTGEIDISDILVYPNPTDRYVYLHGGTDKLHHVLYDITYKSLSAGKTRSVIDLGNYENGVYYLQLSDGSGTVYGIKKVLLIK